MKKVITHINPLDVAILLTCFEGGTLFVMGFLMSCISRINEITCPADVSFNNLELGLFVGFFGTVIALAIWHALKVNARFALDGKETALTHIDVLPAGIANAAFLFVLFTIQDMFQYLKNIPILGIGLLGLITTTIATAILLVGYNYLPIKLHFALGKKYALTSVAPITVALIAGLFELFILPIMSLHISWFASLPLVTAFTFAGMMSGFVGGLIGTTIFNWLAGILEPWIDIDEDEA